MDTPSLHAVVAFLADHFRTGMTSERVDTLKTFLGEHGYRLTQYGLTDGASQVTVCEAARTWWVICEWVTEPEGSVR